MAVECAAVLIMLLAMSIVIRQKGNRGADLAMIPLYFMPAIYLAAGFAARYLPADGPIQPVPFRIVCYLVALLASGIVMGVLDWLSAAVGPDRCILSLPAGSTWFWL